MTSDDGGELLEVGKIGRAHGLKGEVVVDFITDRIAERTEVGAELWAEVGAETTRLEIATARPHQRKWLLGFTGIADRARAERLRGAVLRAEAIEDPDALFVHQLIGKQVIDQAGRSCGTVSAVVDNPASDLLELDDGQLVPLTFLVDVDDGAIRVSIPDGLLD